jgi:hypothetical protein
MPRRLPLAVAFAVLLGTGILHGLWTDRWSTGEEPGAWAARLADVPLTIGDWDAHGIDLEPQQLQVAEVAGSLARNYVNRRTGEVVSVIVVCGHPGPISVHTPDVCYPGSGHELLGAPAPIAVPAGGPDLFWMARFRKDESAEPSYLRVFWAWNASGHWQAATAPRLEFARSPTLYKLYVVRRIDGPDAPLDNDPAEALLARMLPELRRALFPESASSTP